jgi:hypothetical protein
MDHYFPKADKGKSIDTANLSPSEMERRGIEATSSKVTESKTPPKTGFASLLDQIRKRRNDDYIIDTENKESNLTSNIVQETPVINITEPTVTQSEVKSGFASLFDQIRSKRVETPKLSQLGLKTSESPQLLSPLKTKSSFTNLFDDTADLFDTENIEDIIPQNEKYKSPILPEKLVNTRTPAKVREAIIDKEVIRTIDAPDDVTTPENIISEIDDSWNIVKTAYGNNGLLIQFNEKMLDTKEIISELMKMKILFFMLIVLN